MLQGKGSPSERGRNYTPPNGSALRPAGGFLRKADDFRIASIITGDAMLPLRWIVPATPLQFIERKHLALQGTFSGP